MNLITLMPKIYNYSELKNKNMTPNTKTSTFMENAKAILICACILAGFVFMLTISEDKSNLKAIPAVNAEAQSETLSPEKEIEKLKLELEIKQKQAELSKIDPKAQALK
jgi:hypothetical protein